MEIEIDPRSDVPIYQQIRDRTVEAIASRALAAGDQLASVRQLALSFGINVQTVSKAYEALRAEGLIRTNRKSGSVVARGPADGPPAPGFEEDWAFRLTTLLAEAVAQGVPDDGILSRARGVLEHFATGAPAGTPPTPNGDTP